MAQNDPGNVPPAQALTTGTPGRSMPTVRPDLKALARRVLEQTLQPTNSSLGRSAVEIVQAPAAKDSRAGSWSPSEWQAFVDERAGFAEFDLGMKRLAAEIAAYESSIAEWLRQNPGQWDARRCAHCGGLEVPTTKVVPIGINPDAVAWLHPRCWESWLQGRRREAELALLRLGIADPRTSKPTQPPRDGTEPPMDGGERK